MIDFKGLFKNKETVKISAEKHKALNDFVEDEFDKRIEKLIKEFREGERKTVQDSYRKAMKAFTARKILHDGNFISEPLYLMDYSFLEEAYEFLVQDQNEGFCLVTGPETNKNVFALSTIIEPEMEFRSPGGAKPKFGQLADLLEDMLEKRGNRMLSYFHSHPGSGQGATRPSGTDYDTQEKFERGGYPAIGAIFSRDGYIRFYSYARAFQIEVSGKGGEQVEQGIFKLDRGKIKKVSNTESKAGS
ncbi:MAG: hypothetical protein ABEK17_01220 [Candidatus Aenigmatarchaeota archaeon]